MKPLYLTLFFALLGIYSCKKESANTPPSVILYDINGSVNLYDEGVTPLSDSGMMISIVGSDPLIFDESDNEGNFTLKSIAKGTYTLAFEKSNYGTYKRFDVNHNSEGPTSIIQNPSLGEISTTTVSALNVMVVNDTLILNTTLDQEASSFNPKYVRVLFGISSDLNPENYSHATYTIEKQINPFTIKFSKADLMAFGFEENETVYVNVAGESYWGNTYFDPELGREVFPNISWQEGVQSFIMP